MDDVTYPDLWAHYVAYVKAALALIRGQVGERRTEWGVVLGFADPLQKLPEFESLEAFIASSPLADRVFVDGEGKPIGKPEPQSRCVMNYVMPTLMRYVGREGMLDFDEARAREIYADLEASLECTEAVYCAVAPLQHFAGPGEEIRVDATLVLRKLTQLEKDLMIFLGEFRGGVDRSIKFCLAASVVAERYAPIALPAARDLMLGVTALRLLKPGRVGVPAVLQYKVKPEFGPHGDFEKGTSGAPAAAGPWYSLLLEEAEPLVCLYQALAELGASKTLPVALRRFNQGYERERPDDRLIDHWVALEALFLPDDPPQELRHRASLRVAWFVAQGAREREQIFRQIRDSYDARSAIVHGREPKDVRKTAQFTEDVLRHALRKAVTAPTSLDTRDLDEVIVRGSSCMESAHDSRVPSPQIRY